MPPAPHFVDEGLDFLWIVRRVLVHQPEAEIVDGFHVVAEVIQLERQRSTFNNCIGITVETTRVTMHDGGDDDSD